MAGLIGALSSGNKYADIGDGAFHYVDSEETANYNGFDWNDVFWYGSDEELPGSIGDPLGAPAPQDYSEPQYSPLPPEPAYTPPPESYADASSAGGSFEWGGQTWRYGDIQAFINWLEAHNVAYYTWANNHPAAAAMLEGPQYSAEREPIPKSLGEALALPIQAGATAEEAAAQAEALRAAQVAAGLSSVTAQQLLDDARALVIQLQNTPPPAQPPAPATPDYTITPPDYTDEDRALQSAAVNPSFLINVPGDAFHWTIPDSFEGIPTAKGAWRALVKTLANDMTDSVLNANSSSKRFLSKVR